MPYAYSQTHDLERIQKKCEKCGKWFVPFKTWDRPRICPKCIEEMEREKNREKD